MLFGEVSLFCPVCGKLFNATWNGMYHNEFGILCSKPCYEAAKLKYARVILGKDEA